MNIRQIIQRFQKQATVTTDLLLQMEGMRERNEDRIKAIKAEMGEKYAHAKSQYIKRLDEPRPV